MGKTLFMGDSHSDFITLERFAFFALERFPDIDRIVQVGDFGLWPDFSIAYWYQESSLRIPLHFIDGNHEDHRLLHGRGREPFSPSPLYDAVYLPRGYAQNGFLYLGGAHSIDKEYRHPGIDWFAEENISDEDAEAALAAAASTRTHTMVCHETTEGAFAHIRKSHWSMGDPNRLKLERVFQAAKPRLYIHGHYHFYREYEHNGCLFIALANVDHYHYEALAATHAELQEMVRRCCVLVDDEGRLIEW